MTTHTPTLPRASELGLWCLGMAALLHASGCLSIGEETNAAPVAVVTASGSDVRVVAQTPSAAIATVMVAAGSTVTLDGSMSVDPDGDAVRFEWWNTGLTRAQRYPASAMPVGGAGPGPVDPAGLPRAPAGTAATLDVTVPDEGAFYSLYVIDARGHISIPATVKFAVP